jgi:hypothetical protein
MPERKIVTTRVATSHPIPAYGGVRLADAVLDQIAAAMRAGTMPVVVNHDVLQDLGARCVNVVVVELPDGFKAVDAELDVDARAWDIFEAATIAAGAPGGMSFTASTSIGELSARDDLAGGELAITADAGHFTDADIAAAATELVSVGPVKVQRLYQFSHAPACRVIVEYVHASGGLDGAAAALSVGLSVAAAAIYDCLKRLLPQRSRAVRALNQPAQIEIHLVEDDRDRPPQKLVIQSDDLAVVKRALDHLAAVDGEPGAVAAWDDDRAVWSGQDGRGAPPDASPGGVVPEAQLLDASEGLDLAQFASLQDAISQVAPGDRYVKVGAGFAAVGGEVPASLIGLFWLSMIARAEGLHQAIAREIEHGNPHATLPLVRALTEAVVLLIYVVDHPDYVDLVTVRASELPPGRESRESVHALIAYASTQAPGLERVYAELSEGADFGATAMWAAHQVDDDAGPGLLFSWRSAPRWRGDEQAMVACAQTLELADAMEAYLRRFAQRHLGPPRRRNPSAP